MIHSTIRMELESGKHGDTLHLLCSIAQRTRSKPGCISCCVYRDIENDSMILFEQLWRNQKYLRHHLRSDDYQKVLLIVEVAMHKPEICFNSIANTTGVETIQKARKGRKTCVHAP